MTPKFDFARPVTALCDIPDSPVARDNGGAIAGSVGFIDDVADGWVMVDFGNGAILCASDEIRQ